MEKIILLQAVFLCVTCLAIFTSGSGYDDARLEYFKRVPRERRQSDGLMESIRRLVRRETIRRHKYHLLGNWQLVHSRRKRGWIGDDPINRATETPGSTSTTPSSPPPPPINPSIAPVTPKIVTVVTTTPSVSTTASTTIKSVPTTKPTISSTIEMTGTSTSTSNTTESSSAPGLVYCRHHGIAAIVTTFLFQYMYL